jgi:hypothetical protein
VEDTYQDQYYHEAEPKRGTSGWLIAVIVILVLICICCVLIAGVLILAGPAVGNVFSNMIETIEAATPVP